MDNYYRELNVAPNASPDEIKKALNRERRAWSNKTNAPQLERRQRAERMVKLLDEAEQVLLDPARRQQYDYALQTAPVNQPQMSQPMPGDQQDWLQEGQRLLVLGNIPDALFAATRATQQDGNNPEAWALLGEAQSLWGMKQEAIYAYGQAVRLRPNMALYYYELGSIFESIEAWPQALQQYEWAARIEPATAMFRAAIGWVLVQTERYQAGIQLLERCVAEEPNNLSYQQFLAIAYADGSYEHWTSVPPDNKAGVPAGYYATTKRQVQEALASVQKAQMQRVQMRELAEAISAIQANIQSMLHRRFHGNWFAIGASLLLGIILILPVTGLGVYFLFFGALYAASCFTPQYLLNRKIIGGGGRTSGDYMANLVAGDGGCWVVLISLGVILLLLPVMTAWNFLRNYDSWRIRGFGLGAVAVVLLMACVILPGITGGHNNTVLGVGATATPAAQACAGGHISSSYPRLASAYQGTADNITVNASAPIVLNTITQNQQYICGNVFWGHGLVGNGPFTGTIGTDGKVTFSVKTIIFNGALASDGSFGGTYHTVPSPGQTGQNGTWQTKAYQPAPNPQLVVVYQGTVYHWNSNETLFDGQASLILNSIVQNQQNISGNVIVGPGLNGSGAFTGTIGADNIVTFTDTDTTDGFTINFTGLLFPDGSMSGTYNIPNSNQNGVWAVAPA